MILHQHRRALDTAFDTDGKQQINFGAGSGEYQYGLRLASDGKIVVAGVSAGDFAVARLNVNGSQARIKRRDL